jgi:hypothetical protein
MIPVESNKFLFRDENTNAIINCSDFEYQKYLKVKEDKMKEIEKSKRIEEDVIKIKNDIDEIKDLLKKLISSK